MIFLPSVDLGQGPKIGGGSWQWGMSTNCATPEGAADYLKFAAQDKYVASVAKATTNIPATDAAAAEVPGFGPGEENEVFFDYAKKFAVLRPVTPGYTVHRDRVHQDRPGHSERGRSAAGPRPGRQEHRRQPEVQQQLPVTRRRRVVGAPARTTRVHSIRSPLPHLHPRARRLVLRRRRRGTYAGATAVEREEHAS